MIDPQARSAIESSTAAMILPDRQQARASVVTDAPRVVDTLELGRDEAGTLALVAVVEIGDRLVIAPGRVSEQGFERDPRIASMLNSGTRGAFNVELVGDGIPSGEAQRIDVDQSNDSILLGTTMVKWQLDTAVSPAPSRLRALEGTNITPPLRAIVTWRDASGVDRLVLTATSALAGAEDGWTWAVELVRSHARGDDVDASGPFAQLGRMTAGMHVRLASIGVTSWSSSNLHGLHGECVARLDEAVRLIDGEEGARLRARSAALRTRLDSLLEIDATPAMATHGDLHIGQVLRYADDQRGMCMAIIDFDGNPVLPPMRRMEPQPVARDVAGMLASIDHVARVVNHRTEGIDPTIASAWIPSAQRTFLDSYCAELATAGQSSLLDDRLLPALLVDQESREYLYAAAFLPHWRYVPDAAITAMFP